MDYTPVNQTYEVFSKTFGIPALILSLVIWYSILLTLCVSGVFRCRRFCSRGFSLL